jgi:hypothetical protein
VVQWGGVGTAAGPAYRYDLAFAHSDIPADETFVAGAGQLAVVHQHYYTDPAVTHTIGVTVSQPIDPFTLAAGFYSNGGIQTMPGDVTQYLGTADGGSWMQFTVDPAFLYEMVADTHTFAPYQTYSVDWEHGPLAATLGQHTGPQLCIVCEAGSTLSVAFNSVGDSTPDHAGYIGGGTTHFTLYRDGTQVFGADGYRGVTLTGVPTGAATYRAVYDQDMTGVGGSLSLVTHTDLTVSSATSSALPAEDACYSQAGDTPCRILPALSLGYRLATGENNVSSAAIQTLGLSVGHLSYDGVGSTAAITSVTVSVSFDSGKTWTPATVSGQAGSYIAAWANPASAKGTSPELQVSATDAVGGRITQTITHAYAIAS